MPQDVGSIVGLRYTRRRTYGGVRKLQIGHKRFKKGHYCGALLLPRIGLSLVLHFVRWNFSRGRLGELLAARRYQQRIRWRSKINTLPLTPRTPSRPIRLLCK
jgi:hypothetical protein